MRPHREGWEELYDIVRHAASWHEQVCDYAQTRAIEAGTACQPQRHSQSIVANALTCCSSARGRASPTSNDRPTGAWVVDGHLCKHFTENWSFH